MNRVKGKIALVTGAGLGLGRATALMLAREGAKVAVTDVKEAEGAGVADEIVAAGGEAMFMAHDVADADAWRRVIDAAVKRFGGLDILVNNAGVSLSSKIEETPLEKWRWLMSINLDGVFLGTKHAIVAMKDRGGSIINLRRWQASSACRRSARTAPARAPSRCLRSPPRWNAQGWVTRYG